MVDLINSILSSAENYSYLAPILLFTVAFLESTAFLGLAVPGTVFLLIAGGLFSVRHFMDLGDAIWVVALAAILGHSLSFYLGGHGTRLFKKENRIFKLSHLEAGEVFFKKHGSISVFWGQFIGPLRPLIPFVAGMFKMDWKRFAFLTVSSAFGWSALYLTLGYFFGYAWQTAEAWTFRVGIILISFALFYIIKAIYLKNKSKFRGVNSFAAFLVPAAILFVILEYLLITRGGVIDAFNFVEYFYAVRDWFWMTILLWVTTLGNEISIISIAVVASIILWLYKKRAAAVSLWVAVLGAGLFTLLGKTFLLHARPGGFIPVYIENSSSFPSGHAALSVALYGFLVSFLIQDVFRKRISRAITFLLGAALILAIGFSRLYLGLHFVSDILSGYIIGLFWLFVADSFMDWEFLKKDIIFPNISARNREWIVIGMVAWWVLFFAAYALNWMAGLLSL